MRRADLLALTPDTLAALTNRGLLRRATKAVDAGEGPTVTTDVDGTVHGAHPDGVRTTLPADGGLDAARCTCGAPSTCRHVLALVLAYQASASAPTDDTTASADATDGPAAPGEVVHWSPAEFTDEAIAAHVGERLFVAARRVRRTGYTARVRRPTPDDPAPRVELPSCTVRFLVPHELRYVHTDAAAGSHPEALVLAVWAYRVADAQAPDAPEVHVEVGDDTAAADAAAGLTAAVDLASDVLLEGAVHTGTSLAAAFAVARRDLDAHRLRWPLLALDDLAAQLEAYAARSARYRPERLAELVTELHARQRAAATGNSPRSRVLGTEEAAETPLRRVRLASLGCRVTGTAEERTAQVYLAHPDTATVLVLRQDWPIGDADPPPTGHDLAARRLAGSTLGVLAAGNVVTESAVRSASRRVRLTTGRLAKSMITPSNGSWESLPDDLVIRDVAAAARAMERLPPRLIRARVDAESVRVLAIGAVESISYSPGDQRLDAVVTDPAGGSAIVSAVHRAVCPAALDAVAAALAGEHGTPRFVSGIVHRARGGLVLDPVAIAADTLVVPDLAPGDGSTALTSGATPPADDLTTVLEEAIGLLAEIPHRGARHLPPTFPERLHATAHRLSGVGLPRTADAVRHLAASLAPTPGEATIRAWVDAQLRLLVTAEHHATI